MTVLIAEGMTSGWMMAGGAAAVTLLASCWGYLQTAYQHLLSRILVPVTASGFAADALLLYLKSNCRASRFGPREYLGWMLFVRPRQRVQLVPMEITPRSGKVYWQGMRPLWVSRQWGAPEEVDSGSNARDFSDECVRIVFLRGMFDADQLMVDAAEWYNRQVMENPELQGRRHSVRYIHGTAGRSEKYGESARKAAPSSPTDIRSCLHHRSLTWSLADLGTQTSGEGRPTERLALCSDAQKLVQEAIRWKESETWYKQRNVPWRRGWLLHGRPGTGKTALARAVAEELDLPVFAYDLASLFNSEFQEAWSEMLAQVPCMALIEDIDAVFDGRKNVSSGNDRQSLTFDCLLNGIDGIQRADGVLLVITTNCLEKVDPALGRPDPQTGSSRPGRIDRVVELGPLDLAGRRKLARLILADCPAEWDELVAAGAGDTAAQFQERCARRALDLKYQLDSGCSDATIVPSRASEGHERPVNGHVPQGVSAGVSVLR
ncbi:AAA family ATPase [Maioricimonas sp. JC845]|uniref:AAA family ATPase n=1 Tax=Maioricimonas sp. JC845 TaxID=3232138 RepID=UPI00345978E4